MVAQCPPPPIPKLSVSSAQIYQDATATLDSAGTVAGYAGGVIQSYSWRVVKAPTDSAFFPMIASASVISTSSTIYTTARLAIAGQYQLMLSVFDGCSTASAVVCFEVQCNCGPTANAGATTTIWTNTGAAANEGHARPVRDVRPRTARQAPARGLEIPASSRTVQGFRSHGHRSSRSARAPLRARCADR